MVESVDRLGVGGGAEDSGDLEFSLGLGLLGEGRVFTIGLGFPAKASSKFSLVGIRFSFIQQLIPAV